MNTPEGARKGAITRRLKHGDDTFADAGRKGGKVSGNRPMRDRPGYAAELAKKRWDKVRAEKEKLSGNN